MLQNYVKVCVNPNTGNVYTLNEAGTHCTVMVRKEVVTFKNNFMNKSSRSAFIRGKKEDMLNLKFKEGQALPGTIIQIESFTPQYDGHNPKINPSTNELVLTQGRPTYITYQYTTDCDAKDVFLAEAPEMAMETMEATAEAEAAQTM